MAKKETAIDKRQELKTTISQFCDLHGGITPLDRKAVVKKFKKEIKSYKQWVKILTDATVIKKKKE